MTQITPKQVIKLLVEAERLDQESDGESINASLRLSGRSEGIRYALTELELVTRTRGKDTWEYEVSNK